jgi:hypothetical protein
LAEERIYNIIVKYNGLYILQQYLL